MDAGCRLNALPMASEFSGPNNIHCRSDIVRRKISDGVVIKLDTEFVVSDIAAHVLPGNLNTLISDRSTSVLRGGNRQETADVRTIHMFFGPAAKRSSSADAQRLARAIVHSCGAVACERLIATANQISRRIARLQA